MTATPTNNPAAAAAPSSPAGGAATDRLSLALADRYRIERHLGAGGMATVYLAQDLKHDRKVAIKVLKPELAAVLGAERFVVEIKTTAALQHPHILPLFDSGSADGFLYYVMPFIEGETLRDKLNRETQLGVDDAVRITREVADALDYAHRRGVIHRDIKPENILLHDGRPVVADFGIALAVSAAAGGRMTETGLSLGTPHYMSPEQATADKEITGRSDVYSLATVLYEMLAGQPPHLGGSAQQVIMKIIAAPIEAVTRYRKAVPPNVGAALAKALEKLPADRFETAKAFADALVAPSFATAIRSRSVDAAPPNRRMVAALGSLAVVALAGVAGAIWFATRHPAPPPLSRFTVELPESTGVGSLIRGNGVSVALSPDGSQLAFVGRRGRDTRLYLRRQDELVAQPVRGSDGAQQVAFSPDGQSLVFHAYPALKVVATTGGTPRVISEAGSAPHWGRNNLIAYSGPGGIWIVAPDGGQSRLLIGPDSATGRARVALPHILPSGSHALITWWKRGAAEPDSAKLGVVSLEDGTFTDLGVSGSHPRYVAPGYILFGRAGGELYAAPFSLRARRITGSATLVAQEVWQNGNPQTSFAVSDAGNLVYQRGVGPDGDRNELCLVDRRGSETCLPGLTGSLGEPRVSPDGKRVAVRTTRSSSTGDDENLYNIAVYDIAAGTTTRVVTGAIAGRYEWTRSGDGLLFVVPNGDSTMLMARRWDLSGPAQVVARGGRHDLLQVWPGPRGGWTVIRRGTSRTGTDLLIAPSDSLDKARPFATQARDARISPNGRLVTFVSVESPLTQVYVTTLPGPGPRVSVSVNGADQPQWSPDGRTIFYRTESHMMAATVTEQPALTVTRRDTLFEERDRFVTGGPTRYDVMPDGRLLMERRRATSLTGTDESLVWISNWTRLLERTPGDRLR